MTEQTMTKAPRDRSPSFPIVPLKIALERLKDFEAKFGRAPAPANRTYLAWGYKGDTSQAQQMLAALKSFGLVEYNGSGVDRPVSITEDARTYMRANQDSIKQDVVRKLALRPAWIAKMWELWGAHRHPDEVCLDALILKFKFNEQGARRFLSVYDQTIAFAGLTDSDKVVVPTGDASDTPLEEAVEVGDLVQVEIGGMLQLPKAARIRAIHTDQGIDWVFLEGSEAGIQMEHVVLERKGDQSSVGQGEIVPPRLPETKREFAQTVKPGMKEEKNALDEGEAILILPENLSAASVDDLQYWLQGILRKARRRAGVTDKPNALE